LPLGAGESGTHLTRHLDRLVASPTPLGPLVMLGDEGAWRVEVPEGVVVCVNAREDGAAPFTLRATHGDSTLASPVPSLAQSLTLPGPAAWELRADPAFGADVHVTVDLRGAYVECGNQAAAFTLTDLPASPPCATEVGACLP
jgi:hypothetical protein